jgi:hypothetical protein
MDDDRPVEEIILELELLEAEEREVSAQRRRLHQRLDAFPNELTRQQEQELSARRKELHRQIDRLRVKVGRQPGPIR